MLLNIEYELFEAIITICFFFFFFFIFFPRFNRCHTSMGEGSGKQMALQGACSIRQNNNYAKRKESWAIMEGDDDHDHDDLSDTTSSTSNRSTYSSDVVDDASSSASSSCSSSLRSGGSLYDLSDLTAQLPIKRGLSMYFQGKSQSFTSLSKVNSIEDLAKKETPYQRSKALKSCKSYGGGLGNQRSYSLIPKPTISKVKKSSRGPSSSASFTSRRGTSLGFINNNVLPR
ncbi:protein OXIDATIVE STRESS 3-like [Argentina anserina]|uniref:protein OXIDATIVE STRESS 3-like n=1 Tax=Argentina anserina TaxID=57926 RepID=UPI002176495C|nr:protein OXIDATIVE STRESS 3-like [Potentilla anserina]